jgi:hypothetical protein
MFKVTHEKKLWGIFLILNCLLFLPGYLLDIDSNDFFPIHQFTSEKESLYGYLKVFFIRDNYDIFRISIDFFVLTFSFLFFRKWFNQKIYSVIVFVYYILILIYQFYYAVFQHIYITEPLFYNDWKSIKIAFSIVNQGLTLNAVLIALSTLLVLGMLFYSNWKLIQYLAVVKPGRVSKIIFVFFLVVFALNLKYKFVQNRSNTVQTNGLFIARNIFVSLETAEQLKKFDLDKLIASNDYSSFTFKTVPNIFFIALESYGSVLYKNAELRKNYLAEIEKDNTELNENGWYASSVFSVSPVHGGLSWISYSSLAYGYNFTNQGTYATLLDNAELDKYDHLFSMLKKKGYRNYRLVPVPEVGKMSIPWDKYTRFFKVDDWIRFKDINYTGKLYGFGPSPADQFSLNFAFEKIKKENNGPFSLFFITQNSHSPFYSPLHPVDNWESLNDGSMEKINDVNFIGIPKIEDYSTAVNYTLEVLVKFIIEKGTENDIFILVGDHQPPFIAQEKDGLETPIHIISKNETFQKCFSTYGFENGLVISDNPKIIRHEGFYSLFARELIQNYGENIKELPVYYPDGVVFR